MRVARTLDAGSRADIAYGVGLHGTLCARFTFHARVERFTAEVVTRTRRWLDQNATVGSWIAAAAANTAVTNTAVETGELAETARLTALFVAVAKEPVRAASLVVDAEPRGAGIDAGVDRAEERISALVVVGTLRGRRRGQAAHQAERAE